MLFSLLCLALQAQYNVGGKISAMASAGVALQDSWSMQLNPAGISGMERPVVGLTYAKHYLADELSEQAATFIIPLGKTHLGTTISRYGIEQYHQLKATLGLAKSFGDKLSIGLSGSYHQLKIDSYGSTKAFSVDIGALYRFSSTFTLGLSVSNPSLQKFATMTVKLSVPSIVRLGLAYRASNKVLVATALTKNFAEKLDVAIGIDYQLLDLLSLRGGLSAKPFKQYAGFGLTYRKLVADFALQNNPNLGYIPQIAIGYAF